MDQGVFRAWQPTDFQIWVSFLPLLVSSPAFCFLLDSFAQRALGCALNPEVSEIKTVLLTQEE